MRDGGLQGLDRRRIRRGRATPAIEEELVQRRFTVAWRDRLWLTDITEHPMEEGKLCCRHSALDWMSPVEFETTTHQSSLISSLTCP